MSDSAIVATRIGPGHRTTAAPILRQPRTLNARLGSSTLPKRLATVMIAALSVSAAKTPTVMPIASGTPSDWKYGSLVKLRQKVAPAMVRPEPSTTWAVPPYIV